MICFFAASLEKINNNMRCFEMFTFEEANAELAG